MSKKRETTLDKKIRLTKECRDGKWRKLSSGKFGMNPEPACALCLEYYGCTDCPLEEYTGKLCNNNGHPYLSWRTLVVRVTCASCKRIDPSYCARNGDGCPVLGVDKPKAVAAAKKVRDALTGTLKMLRKQKREKNKKGGKK